MVIITKVVWGGLNLITIDTFAMNAVALEIKKNNGGQGR